MRDLQYLPIPPDFAAFWRQAAQQGYTKIVKICQTAKTGLIPTESRRSASSASTSERRLLAQGIPVQVLAHRRLRHRTCGRLREDFGQTVDPTTRCQLALLDAGMTALQSERRSGRTMLRSPEAIATLKTTTIAGLVDFTTSPVPNVATGPIIGTQWVKAKAGSKFPLDYVVTDNATDPNVPIGAKLIPFQRLSARKSRWGWRVVETGLMLKADGIHKRFGALVGARWRRLHRRA